MKEKFSPSHWFVSIPTSSINFMRSSLTVSQNVLKKSMLKPSGPEALSILKFRITTLISS